MERRKGKVRRRWKWERVALAKNNVRGLSDMYDIERGKNVGLEVFRIGQN